MQFLFSAPLRYSGGLFPCMHLHHRQHGMHAMWVCCVQLQHSFLDVDAGGAYMQRDVQEVAALLSLPVGRAANLLRRAKRDIPLVADPEPIQVRSMRSVFAHAGMQHSMPAPNRCATCQQAVKLWSTPCCCGLCSTTVCAQMTEQRALHAYQVLYEDDYVIAVSKPPGLITAPKHRHVVRQWTTY